MKDFRNVTKTIWLLVFGVVSLFLLACEDQTSDIPHTNSEFSISMPEGVENLKVVDQTLKMTNLSTLLWAKVTKSLQTITAWYLIISCCGGIIYVQ